MVDTVILRDRICQHERLRDVLSKKAWEGGYRKNFEHPSPPSLKRNSSDFPRVRSELKTRSKIAPLLQHVLPFLERALFSSSQINVCTTPLTTQLFFLIIAFWALSTLLFEHISMGQRRSCQIWRTMRGSHRAIYKPAKWSASSAYLQRLEETEEG